MTQAEIFIQNYQDVSELMKMLDAQNIYSEQDYENETTTWYFGDGSFVKIQNESVQTGTN